MLPKLPTSIEILNVALGATQGSRGGFYAKSDAVVTASLEGSSVGQFRIVRMETDDVVTDPDGPHGGIQVLQFAQAVDGPGPIDVSEGQALLITVEFSCPADPRVAKFQAVVAVHGFPASASVSVVATAALGRVDGVGLDGPPMLPGSTATFHFRLFSSKGHDVPALFIYDASETHFAAPARSVTVPAGGSVDLAVPVTCASGTPEGQYSLGFQIRAQDGPLVFGSVQVGATVTRTVQVFTNLPGDFTLLQGDDALCELRVVVSGSPAQLAVSHGPVPPELTVTPDNRFVTVDGMAFTNFDFEISPNVPPRRLAPLAILWTVRDPEISGHLVFNIEIVADQAVLPLPQPLSQLSQENNPKPVVCDHAVLTICNSGSWNLTAHFENQETLADVSFVFEAGLSFVDAAGNRFGESIDGALSAAGDGPATQSGLRTLGYPPAGTFHRHGTFAPFQNPTYWLNAKISSPQYRMLAAFGEPAGGNIPDPPDVPDPKRPSEEG